MYKIKKEFIDYPFAHRQPEHQGHCSLIHGHNWSFIIELGAEKLDECGFVYDFGKFKGLKKCFEDHFDHTLVLNQDDPLSASAFLKKYSKVIEVPSCSCEGLAEFIYYLVEDYLIEQDEDERVQVLSVTVIEDSKNSATYES